MKKRMGIVAAVATAMLCSSFAFAAPIKIGLMAPITGAFASEGQDMQKICELMTEELNKAGGINGNKVQLVIEDDGSTPRSAATAASRLVAADVCAAIGTYGSAVTEASQDIYDEAGIVRILDKKSADIVFFDALVPGERDYSAILTKIKGVKPDAILFTGYYPEAGLLLRQMQEMKWAVPIIGGDATNNTDLVKIAGDAAAGYRFISPIMPADIDTPMAKAFLKAYEAKYHSLPSSIWSVLAGDAYNVLIAAIKAKGPDPAAIAGYLHNDLKNLDCFTGQISFDEKGDRVGDLYRLYEVNAKGEFILQPK